jgi:hypothetical protein
LITHNTKNFNRPFPALTPAQRYHFEVYGYVVIENTLTEDETARVLNALQRLKREFEEKGDPTGVTIRGCRVSGYKPTNIHFADVLETDPAILEHITNPRLVGMAEEIVGGVVRLSESEAIINSRDPETSDDPEPKFGFHYGTRPDHGTYTGNGLFHSNFVKTLTNLTELEPDDGGTVVIAGSHKISLPWEDIVEVAYQDRSLIHQIVAPAGSTVLFAESLIHATGQLRSDRERTIIITGYTPPMFKADTGQEPSPDFLEGLPDDIQEYLVGKQQWGWKPRYRSLPTPVEEI